jgi:SAM-dependent methyltransferase
MLQPLRPEQYERALDRRRSGASSPLDPDWLVQRALRRDIAGALARHSGERVLDIGCGRRPYQTLAPDGVKWIGVDASASASSEPDVWCLADALPFASASFSTVLCTQVLEHLAEPQAALAEMARVLAPGGRLILTAPQAWFLHEEPFDFYRYTRFGLDHLCRRAGLAPVETSTQGGFFAMLGIFLIVHVGSYARWAAERCGSGERAARRGTPGWRRMLAPLRWPMAVVNVAFAVLDAIPQPGIFAVNHLVVAIKREMVRPGKDQA